MEYLPKSLGEHVGAEISRGRLMASTFVQREFSLLQIYASGTPHAVGEHSLGDTTPCTIKTEHVSTRTSMQR